jgi:hypothetical protein
MTFISLFIISCSNNTFFTNHTLKFSVPTPLFKCYSEVSHGHLSYYHLWSEISVVLVLAGYVRWLVIVCKILNMWEWYKMEHTFTALHCNILLYTYLCCDGTLLNRIKQTAYPRIWCQFIISTYILKVSFFSAMTLCLWV